MGRTYLMLWLFAAALGCESAQEKCTQARDGAEVAWKAYHGKVEGIHAQAVAAQADAHSKLSGPIRGRMAKAAEQKADTLYDRNSSAWMRTYQSSLHAACSEDPECQELTDKNTEAKDLAERMLPRVTNAAEVLKYVRGPVPKASAAVDTVQDDFDRKELLKTARLASSSSHELCEGLAEAPDEG